MKTILFIIVAVVLSWGQIYNTRAPWAQVFIDSSLNSSYLSCDVNGKYLLCAGTGIPKKSSNYGITWTSANTTGTWTGCRVSKAGKYQFLTKLTDSIYISKDSGATWISKKIATGAYAYDPVCSYFGNIISVAGGDASGQGTKIYISKDTGNTWTNTITLTGSYILTRGSCDSLGVYQIIVLSNDSVLISKDTGTTFNLMFYKVDHTREIYSSIMSFNVKYIALGCAIHGSVAGKIYFSSDTGVTFDSSFQTTSGLGCSMSGNGKIIVGQGCGDGYIISTDYGSTWLWVDKLSDGGGIVWANLVMAANGKYLYMMQNTYCKIYKNQLIQPQRYQQIITVDSLAFSEVDNNFLYTIPVSILSSVFKNNSASDKRDIRVYNSFGSQLKSEIFANGNYVRWLDTAKNTADRVFTFKTGSGDILAYDSTMYLNAGVTTMFHCEDSSTTTIDATGQFHATNISTRNQIGMLGQCYYFTWDGVPDNMNRIVSAGACNYDLDRSFTISGWTKRKHLTVNGSVNFSHINSGSSRGWEILWGRSAVNYRLEWDYFSSGGATIKAYYTDWDTTINVWEKLDFVYNSVGNIMKYYKNGSLITWTGYYGSIDGTSLPTNGLSVGMAAGTGYCDSVWFDEIKICSTLVSANRILSDYRFDNIDSIKKYVTIDSSMQFLGDTGNVWIGGTDSLYSNPANWSKGIKPVSGAIVLDSMAWRPLYIDSAVSVTKIKALSSYQGRFVQQATIKVADTLLFQHYGDLTLAGNDTISGLGTFQVLNIGLKTCSMAIIIPKDSCFFKGSVRVSRIKYTGGYSYRHYVGDTISFKNQTNADFSGSDTLHRVIIKSDTLTRRFFVIANSGIDSIAYVDFRDCWNIGEYINSKKARTYINSGNNKRIYFYGRIPTLIIRGN